MPSTPPRIRVKSAGKAATNGRATIDGIAVVNEMLLKLPAAESDAIFDKLIFLPMRTYDVLHEPGETLKHAYFMNSGLTSILSVMGDGKSVEVGLTGKEGFVGLPLIVGLTSGPTRAVVQIAGSAFRISAADLMAALPQCPTLATRMQRFVQFLAMQGTQVAACNRLHEVDQRLSRWLLMCQDRIGSANVTLTQEFLAHMLGTRRASVTIAARHLQKAGLITYRRGDVKIESRDRLVAATCECYSSMRRQTKSWQSESQ